MLDIGGKTDCFQINRVFNYILNNKRSGMFCYAINPLYKNSRYNNNDKLEIESYESHKTLRFYTMHYVKPSRVAVAVRITYLCGNLTVWRHIQYDVTSMWYLP